MTWQTDAQGTLRAVTANGDYTISTDRHALDFTVIHTFLTQAYWSPGVPIEVVRRATDNSLVFGIYARDRAQVGFARVISDRATFAYLADVFVLQAHRRQGLASWMVGLIAAHPDLQGLRRWVLATRDAHRIYAQHGFTALEAPDTFMERCDPDVYRNGASSTAHAR